MAGNNIFLRNLHLLNDTLKLSSSKRSCRILKEVKRHVASSHIFQTVYSFCFFLYFFHCLSRNIVPSVSGSLRSRRSSTGSNFLGCKLNTEQKKKQQVSLQTLSYQKYTHAANYSCIHSDSHISYPPHNTHTHTHTGHVPIMCAIICSDPLLL